VVDSREVLDEVAHAPAPAPRDRRSGIDLADRGEEIILGVHQLVEVVEVARQHAPIIPQPTRRGRRRPGRRAAGRCWQVEPAGLIRSHALDLLAEDARFEMLTTEHRRGLTHGSGSTCSRTTK
jgi:hypothetical protein